MYKLEITDTFSGQPNYCWVVRGKTRATSKRGVVKAIKALAGWNCRVHVEGDGDWYEIRPSASSGILEVAFAIWEDEEVQNGNA